MPIIFAIASGLSVLFAILAIANGVLASQCMYAIQGTIAEEKLKSVIAATKRSKFIPTLADGHPMDARVWLALRQADYLPEALQRKAQIIGWLYDGERLIFLLGVITIFASVFLR